MLEPSGRVDKELIVEMSSFFFILGVFVFVLFPCRCFKVV